MGERGPVSDVRSSGGSRHENNATVMNTLALILQIVLAVPLATADFLTANIVSYCIVKSTFRKCPEMSRKSFLFAWRCDSTVNLFFPFLTSVQS